MPASIVEVLLPTQTVPSEEQWVIGKNSPLTPDLEEFRGVPFGYVPGRWKHSELRVSLPSKRYDASRNGPKCPQAPEPNNSETFQSHVKFRTDVTESEFECLNLFIIRPSKEALSRIGKGDEKLPVLIWIHGGAFGFGAGTDPMIDPSRLVLESLSLGTPFIAVNLNYRLNLFGFAASSELLADQTGGARKGCNFGLRDQQIGIQWVSQNVTHFGGDPSKITIGGQSAGAASTHAQALNFQLKPKIPLFRKVILQSGSLGCLGPIPLSDSDEKWDKLCLHLGFQKNDSVSRLENLRTLPTEELLRAQRELGWITFLLTIDDVSLTAADVGSEVLVDLDCGRPSNDTTKESMEAIEILLGDTAKESSVFTRDISNIRDYQHAQAIFASEFPTSSPTDEILEAYGINAEIPVSVLHDQIFRFASDVMFGLHLFKARNFFRSPQAKLTSNDRNKTSKFFHPTTVHSYKVKFGNPFPGESHNVSHHCVDMIYLFDAFHDHLLKIDEEESTNSKKRSNTALKKDIQRHWIRFITKEDAFHIISEDQIIVYDLDRQIRIESLSRDDEWVREAKRFEVLERYLDASRKVLASLMGRI